MVITDIPTMIPGLDGCMACVTGKLVHLLHKEGHRQAVPLTGLVYSV